MWRWRLGLRWWAVVARPLAFFFVVLAATAGDVPRLSLLQAIVIGERNATTASR